MGLLELVYTNTTSPNQILLRSMDFRVVHLILTDANQCSQIAPLCGPSTVLLFCSGKQKFAGDSIDLFEKNVKRLFFW